MAQLTTLQFNPLRDSSFSSAPNHTLLTSSTIGMPVAPNNLLNNHTLAEIRVDTPQFLVITAVVATLAFHFAYKAKENEQKEISDLCERLFEQRGDNKERLRVLLEVLREPQTFLNEQNIFVGILARCEDGGMPNDLNEKHFYWLRDFTNRDLEILVISNFALESDEYPRLGVFGAIFTGRIEHLAGKALPSNLSADDVSNDDLCIMVDNIKTANPTIVG